jgi:hypothetical protein
MINVPKSIITRQLHTNILNNGTSGSTNNLIKNGYLKISDEILNSTKPVVALESTIITHGLPYPANLETG